MRLIRGLLAVFCCGCGVGTVTVTGPTCDGLEVVFDEARVSAPMGPTVVELGGACGATSGPFEVRWSDGAEEGVARSACREQRFQLRLPVSEPVRAVAFELTPQQGSCMGARSTVLVTRPTGLPGGGAGGGAAAGGGGGVGAGGGGPTGGGVAMGGGSATMGGGSATTGPGACSAPEVFSFCAGPPRNGRPPDESALIQQLAQQHAGALGRCARRNDEFKRLALTALRARDARWGNNLVRGTAGDTNGNVIGYFYGAGAPVEGSPLTILVEIVSGCDETLPASARAPSWRLVLPSDSDPARCCQPTGTPGIDAKAWTLLNTTPASGAGGGSAGGGPAGGSCGDAFTASYCAGSREPPNERAFIQQLAAQYPTEFSNCDRHQDDFVQIVVRELRARDPRWGFNWVRGNVGDSNGDVIGYYYGPGAPQENSRFTTIIDIVGACGAPGNGESVTWTVYGEANQAECCAPTGAEAWTLQPMRP